ncbi:MAG: ATP-binding protein [Clostridiales bacterium]|nr:ATP-binding protein [Clostridiales bacterium]
MREDLLKELELEYDQVRFANEREEQRRREQIMAEEPEIYALVRQREELIFGTLRNALRGPADAGNLAARMKELSAGIRSKLEEKGFSADYLAPVYRCPVCRDTGRTGDPVKEPCACLKKAYQQKLRGKIGLDSGKNETFESFDLSVFPEEKIPGQSFSQRELMRVHLATCRKWAEEYPDSTYRDLVLTGSTGLGKTFLLHAMADRLIERDINVLLISAYRMLEVLRKSYFENDQGSSELLDADVLMIDDLGSEPLMQNVTVEQLFNLLNERQNRNLSTVISTNLDMAKFRERYTERVASRLRDSRCCKVMNLIGRDIRVGGNLKE